jgi:hypothetical protein
MAAVDSRRRQFFSLRMALAGGSQVLVKLLQETSKPGGSPSKSTDHNHLRVAADAIIE